MAQLLDDNYQQFMDVLKEYYDVTRIEILHNLEENHESCVVITAYRKGNYREGNVQSGYGTTLDEACSILVENMVRNNK